MELVGQLTMGLGAFNLSQLRSEPMVLGQLVVMSTMKRLLEYQMAIKTNSSAVALGKYL